MSLNGMQAHLRRKSFCRLSVKTEWVVLAYYSPMFQQFGGQCSFILMCRLLLLTWREMSTAEILHKTTEVPDVKMSWRISIFLYSAGMVCRKVVLSTYSCTSTVWDFVGFPRHSTSVSPCTSALQLLQSLIHITGGNTVHVTGSLLPFASEQV